MISNVNYITIVENKKKVVDVLVENYQNKTNLFRNNSSLLIFFVNDFLFFDIFFEGFSDIDRKMLLKVLKDFIDTMIIIS